MAPQKRASTPARLCNVPIIAGVDIGVRSHLERCFGLIVDVERTLKAATFVDEGQRAQQRVIVNLGSCVGSAVSAMVILSAHAHAPAILMMRRLVLEYRVRAAYFLANPDHALWATQVEFLDTLLRQKGSRLDAESRVRHSHELNDARRRLAHLTPESRREQGLPALHEIPISEMIRMTEGAQSVRRYRSASLMLHGDLYSAELLVDEPLENMNEAILEAADELVRFVELMCTLLADDSFQRRIEALHAETARLGNRYGWLETPGHSS